MGSFINVNLSHMKHFLNFYWVCPRLFKKAGIYYKSRRIIPICNFGRGIKGSFIEFIIDIK